MGRKRKSGDWLVFSLANGLEWHGDEQSALAIAEYLITSAFDGETWDHIEARSIVVAEVKHATKKRYDRDHDGFCDYDMVATG